MIASLMMALKVNSSKRPTKMNKANMIRSSKVALSLTGMSEAALEKNDRSPTGKAKIHKLIATFITYHVEL